MQGVISIESMESRGYADVLSFSEARAYEALLCCGADGVPNGFASTRVRSAVVLSSSAARSSALFNRVLGLGLREPADEALLDEIEGIYSGLGVPWAIELSDGAAPQNLPVLLKKRGMRRGLGTAMLIRRCVELPGVETALRIERVGPEFGKAFAAIVAPIFRVDPTVKPLLELAATRPGYRQWLAFDGNEAVGGCLSHIHQDVAWLGWSATMPSHRGRGAHVALVSACMHDALEQGCGWVTAETALGTQSRPDPSYLNFLKLGFLHAYTRDTYFRLSRRGVEHCPRSF